MAGGEDPGELRARAEAALSRQGGAEREGVDASETLHELHVHQIELEMQNDELLRTRHELETMRDRYFDLFELAPVGYVTLDAGGRILEANRFACALLGQDRGQLRGRPLSAFVVAAEAAPFAFHLRAALEWREKQVAELQFVLSDEVRWFRLESVRGREASGDVVCRTALIDLTALREAERELATREARLSALLDTAVDAIIAADPGGQITLANRAAEQMFGRPERPLLGRGVGELFAPGARAEIEADLADHVARGHSALIGTVRQVEAIRADGTAFAAEVAVGARPAEEGLVLFVRDVSERARYEEELRRAQKLEAVGRLASGVAHDFNNLLMSISGAAELGLQKVQEPACPARPYLQEIKQEVIAGAGVVKQLLRVGRADVEEPGASVDTTVAAAADMLRRLLGEGVDLRLGLGAAEMAVPVSAGQLQQIILNLATNARDAMPEGGEVRIDTSVVAVAGEAGEAPALPAGSYVCIAMSDTGAGMDQETRARAFEPFFSTKRAGKGTGLGLWSTFQIVREHGGHVAIESRVGGGTTVVIHLPSEAAAGAAVTPEPAVTVAGGAGRAVLLVEDDERVRRTLASYLESGGYRVVAAGDAEEAIALLRSRAGASERPQPGDRAEGGETIDVVLTDMALPKGTGSGVAEVARSELGVPAAFISAYAGATLHESGRLPAGAPFLQKPFSRERLLGWLAGVLPALPSLPAPAAAGSAETRLPRATTVLVVEDQDDLRETLRMLLEMRGYRPVLAGTGAEALAVIEGDEAVDLVLADISLPDIGGADLAQRLRYRAPNLPIVYMSGFLAEDPAVARALAAPRTAFVQKPASIDAIEAGIEALLAPGGA